MQIVSRTCSAATMLLLLALVMCAVSSPLTDSAHPRRAAGCHCYDENGLRAANCTNLSDIAHELEVLRVTDFEDHFTIKDNSFSTLKQLKRLHLSNLHLRKLYSGAFKGLEKLEFLDISNNRFAVPSEITKAVGELPNLRTLILRGNPLGKAPSIISKKISILDLGSCRIGNVSENTFENLIHLKHLKLDNNHITDFKAKVFPANIVSLDLRNNEIKHVPKKELLMLNKLEHIELSGNPIHCTCDLLKMRYDLSMNGPLICEYPEAYKGIDIMDLKKSQLCSFSNKRGKRMKRDLEDEIEDNFTNDEIEEEEDGETDKTESVDNGMPAVREHSKGEVINNEENKSEEEVVPDYHNEDISQPAESHEAGEESPAETYEAGEESPAETHEAGEESPAGEEPSAETNVSGEETPAETHEAGEESQAETYEAGEESAAETHVSGEESQAETHEAGEESPAETHEAGEKSAAETHVSGEESPAETHETGEKSTAETHISGEESPAETHVSGEESPTETHETGEESPAETRASVEESPAENHEAGEESPAETHEAGHEHEEELKEHHVDENTVDKHLDKDGTDNSESEKTDPDLKEEEVVPESSGDVNEPEKTETHSKQQDEDVAKENMESTDILNIGHNKDTDHEEIDENVDNKDTSDQDEEDNRTDNTDNIGDNGEEGLRLMEEKSHETGDVDYEYDNVIDDESGNDEQVLNISDDNNEDNDHKSVSQETDSHVTDAESKTEDKSGLETNTNDDGHLNVHHEIEKEANSDEINGEDEVKSDVEETVSSDNEESDHAVDDGNSQAHDISLNKNNDGDEEEISKEPSYIEDIVEEGNETDQSEESQFENTEDEMKNDDHTSQDSLVVINHDTKNDAENSNKEENTESKEQNEHDGEDYDITTAKPKIDSIMSLHYNDDDNSPSNDDEIKQTDDNVLLHKHDEEESTVEDTEDSENAHIHALNMHENHDDTVSEEYKNVKISADNLKSDVDENNYDTDQESAVKENNDEMNYDYDVDTDEKSDKDTKHDVNVAENSQENEDEISNNTSQVVEIGSVHSSPTDEDKSENKDDLTSTSLHDPNKDDENTDQDYDETSEKQTETVESTNDSENQKLNEILNNDDSESSSEVTEAPVIREDSKAIQSAFHIIDDDHESPVDGNDLIDQYEENSTDLYNNDDVTDSPVIHYDYNSKDKVSETQESDNENSSELIPVKSSFDTDDDTNEDGSGIPLDSEGNIPVNTEDGVDNTKSDESVYDDNDDGSGMFVPITSHKTHSEDIPDVHAKNHSIRMFQGRMHVPDHTKLGEDSDLSLTLKTDDVDSDVPIVKDNSSEVEVPIPSGESVETEQGPNLPVEEDPFVKEESDISHVPAAGPRGEIDLVDDTEASAVTVRTEEYEIEHPAPTAHGDHDDLKLLVENGVGTDSPSESESSASDDNSAGSYIVLAAIMAIVVILLAYSVIRSRRQRNRQTYKKDAENPGRELQDVSKPLIENNHIPGKQEIKDESHLPLMSKEKEASLTTDSTNNGVYKNGNANHGPKSEKDYLGNTDKSEVPEIVVEKCPTPTVTDAPPAVHNNHKETSPVPSNRNSANLKDDGDDEVFTNKQPQHNNVPRSETNGNLAPVVNGNGGVPQSPNSGRVTVIAKELPDSVAKRPVIIVNRGTDPAQEV